MTVLTPLVVPHDPAGSQAFLDEARRMVAALGHVHGFLAGSDGALRHRAFHANLVAHADEARAYGALKERLASLHPDDMEADMDGKDAFVKEREHRALAWWGSCTA